MAVPKNKNNRNIRRYFIFKQNLKIKISCNLVQNYYKMKLKELKGLFKQK